MTQKGSGWKNESRRHSLARKGIKTAKTGVNQSNIRNTSKAGGILHESALNHLILRSVYNLDGQYSKTTIARLLNGTISKKILTINMGKLETYATATNVPKEEILESINWLVENRYMVYEQNGEFNALKLTNKGRIVAKDPAMTFEQMKEEVRCR